MTGSESPSCFLSYTNADFDSSFACCYQTSCITGKAIGIGNDLKRPDIAPGLKHFAWPLALLDVSG